MRIEGMTYHLPKVVDIRVLAALHRHRAHRNIRHLGFLVLLHRHFRICKRIQQLRSAKAGHYFLRLWPVLPEPLRKT